VAGRNTPPAGSSRHAKLVPDLAAGFMIRQENDTQSGAAMSTDHPEAGGYWPSLLLHIRETNKWSQERLASEIGSNQETVSRWERGLVLPSRAKQAMIERIAEHLQLASLSGLASIVRLSPYPMLLCSRRDVVVAASTMSGFEEGRAVLAQTPGPQHGYYQSFVHQLQADGFWQESGQTRNYAFHDIDGRLFSAVLVSINVRGEMYCVVQAIPPQLAQ
jgi:DNA-binding transcriptional regulator YiaG